MCLTTLGESAAMTRQFPHLRFVLVPLLGAALSLLFLPQSATAALGVGLQVDGSNATSVVQGGTIELTWAAVDADSATGWAHQGGTPVALPGWDGPQTVNPKNSLHVTVNLPPGVYTVVIEATSEEGTVYSSVPLTVLPNDSEDTPDDDTPDDDSDTTGQPTVAPRAGLS